jgi:hypothetical protein
MRRDLLRRGDSTASILAACATAFAVVALPIFDTATAGKRPNKARYQERSYVLEGRHRGYRRSGSQRIYLPVGPAYVYYDYPYYYSRGHYPTHIGGYVYYIPERSARCTNRKCAANRRASLSAR